MGFSQLRRTAPKHPKGIAQHTVIGVRTEASIVNSVCANFDPLRQGQSCQYEDGPAWTLQGWNRQIGQMNPGEYIGSGTGGYIFLSHNAYYAYE